METSVIIIGGGIAGLACAVALSDSGLRPVVLERDRLPGGRARSWTDRTTGDRVDIGPHILLSEYRNMLRLLDLLGTRQQVVWQDKKFITLVDRPHPVTIRMSRLPAPLHFLPSLLKVPQVSQRDLVSNARLLWLVARLTEADSLELDGTDAESFLRRMSVSERFIEWFWRSAAMTIMNTPLERCSAGALLGFFRYMMGISGYQVGFPAGGLGDLFAPAAARRIEAAGGRVLLNTAAAGITGNEQGVTGVRLTDGSHLAARWCVAAIPPQELPALLPDAWVGRQAQFRALSEFAPSPYVSSYLWFDRKLTDERFWSRVWSPETLNYDFYDLSNIRPGWGERPSVIAANLIYSDRAAHLSDEEIVAATVHEIAGYAPVAAQARVRHASVHRIPMAIPAPYPGTERLRPGPETPVEGLYLAGDWLQTGLPASMESAVRGGWLAAERVLAAAGRPRQVALPPPEVTPPLRLLAHLRRWRR